MTITRPDPKPSGPKLEQNDWGVEIILVRDEVVLAELGRRTLGDGPPATVTLAHVAKHIGKPNPTDIVVFARRPFHFADGQLRAHPKVHEDFPETVTVLSRGKHDRAVWWSREHFTITSIRPAGHGHANPNYPEATTVPPPYPFAAQLTTRVEQSPQGVDLFVVRSTEPIAGTEQHMYKIEFTMAGSSIDPDAYCSP
jgi:hypothetical protein